MKLKKKFFNLMCLCLLLSGTPVAWAAKIECPAGMMTNQTMLGKEQGWEVYVDSVNNHHSLSGITFYATHPKNMASLAPGNEDTKGNKLVWKFAGDGKDEIWLACRYRDTNVQLIQKLPLTIKSCTVTYDEQHISINSNVKSIDCQ